ncbi:MAG: glycosyltransferase [Butyrivibrio sp.]|nr:glycosyltransferase [Butyrivibrio sp.]
MELQPKVSVIIPAYNVGAFISECIESAINQTYPNLEIIIIDDGSVDDTPIICDHYADMDKRILVKHQPNGGLSAARNEGLKLACGDYLFFLDSDDYLESDAIEYLVNLSQKYDADICAGSAIQVTENKQFVKEMSFPGISSEYQLCYEHSFWQYAYANTPCIPAIVVWTKLYKKRLFANLSFKENFIHEDEEILHKVVSISDTIILSVKNIYNYRLRSDSVMDKPMTIKNLCKADFLSQRLNYFIQKEYTDLYLSCFGDGAYVLRKAYSTDAYKNDTAFKLEVNRLYKEYKKHLNYIYSVIPSKKLFIQKTIFNLNLGLYNYISQKL